MSKLILSTVVAGAALFAGAGVAEADSWRVGVSVGGPVYGGDYARPGYCVPRPVYCAPRPVYCLPRPVYCAPNPVYFRPAPVYHPRPAHYRPYGAGYRVSASYYGGRYYGGSCD